MRSLFAHGRLCGRLLLVLICCGGALLPAIEGAAVPLQSLDSTGEPVDLKAEVANDPKSFILLMKQEFARGNIDSAGYFAEQLVRLQPLQAEARAIYSIFLASQGKETEAREQFTMAKQSDPQSLLTLCAEALLLQREKKYPEAISVCERAIALDPKHAYPRNILGRVYTEIGQTAKALDSFQKAVEVKPDFLLGYINLGAVSYLAGEQERALAAFTKALELDRNATSAYFGIAVVYETMGENRQALQALQSCLKINPGHQGALESLGKLQLKEGLTEQALQTGQEMINRHMETVGLLVLAEANLQAGKTDEAVVALQKVAHGGADAPYLLGYCAMVQGNYQEAKKKMEEVLQQDPRHFGAYTARVALKLALGEPIQPKDELVNHWDPAMGKMLHFLSGSLAVTEKRWPEAFKAFQASEGMINGYALTGIDEQTLAASMHQQEGGPLALGVLYYFKQLYGPSLDAFAKAVALNNRSVLGNYWAGQVCLQQKNRVTAMQYFKGAVQGAPRFFSALYALGELHVLARNFEAAAEYYRQAAAVQPDPGVLIKLGLYNEQKGNNQEAAKYYQEVINNSPTFFVGYNQLAWLYAKQGIELDKAMKLAKKADELQPGNASILDTIGWVHFQKKEYTAAVLFFEKALATNQNNPTVYYHLGRSFLAMGKQDAGQTHLRRALELSSTFDEADEARKLLHNSPSGKE